MATKLNLKCVACEATDSLMWRGIEGGPGNICQNCYEKTAKESEEESVTSSKTKSPEEKKLRKSTRISKKAKNSPVTVIGLGGKGAIKSNKIKRIGQKKTFKTPAISITTKNVASVSHKGSMIRIGDIVSLMDAHDNLFYAQVRGLTVNMYCEKHAYITWLIPTKVSPPPNERFDASTYLIGHDEDTPRSLNLLEFVMHAPSNYYHDKTQPLPYEERPVGYTWTRFKKRPGLGRKPAAATATTCTLTSGTSQNVVTTTTATVTMPTPESLTETTAGTADNSATSVTSTTTASAAAPAVSSTTTSEQ